MRTSLPPRTRVGRTGPDRDAALSQYRSRASTYDLELAPFEPLRRLAIGRLGLHTGQSVLDVGCGTGLSLALLKQAVGRPGRVVGIEQSPQMLARAQARVQSAGLTHVKLVCAPVEEARITLRADAALLHFTHDILRRPEALDQVLRHLAPGARLVATGLQWAPAWAVPLNLFVWGAALRSVSSLRGLQQPWDLLAERADIVEVQTLLMGAVYLVVARRR